MQKIHKIQCDSPVVPAAKRRQKLGRIAKVLLPVCLLTGALVFARAGLFGYSLFVVGGQSMQPEYPPHSLVLVKKTDFSALSVGDAIVFKSDALGGKSAFHRVIKVTNDGVFTKGDNNYMADNQLITRDSFCGKMTAKTTAFAGYLRLVSGTGGAIVFLYMPVLAAVLFFAALNLKNIGRDKNRANDESDK